MAKRLEPKKVVIRRLFALSGNLCAFPECEHRLISDKGKFIAELAHIEGVAGERYNPAKDPEEQRQADNLILLCHAHHVETNDEQEYTVAKMRQIKDFHEAKYLNNQYRLPEQFAETIFKDLDRKLDALFELSMDTNQKVTQMLQLMVGSTERPLHSTQIDFTKIHIEDLDNIKEYRRQNRQEMVLSLLNNYKENKWESLTPELKYRVNMNLALTYFDLHRDQEALRYIFELEQIPHKTEDGWSLLAMASAINKDQDGFDRYFTKVQEYNPENINAWLARIIMWPETEKISIDKIPIALQDKPSILFNMARIMERQGDRDDAINYYLNAVALTTARDQLAADIKAIVGTKLIEMQANPFKAIFNHFSSNERENIDKALQYLSEAWDLVKDNDLRYSRYFILINRGVVYRMKNKVREAIKDFQLAYELSPHFLCLQYLLNLYLNDRSLGLADDLLNEWEGKSNLTEQENFEITLMRARWYFIMHKFSEGTGILSKYLESGSQFAKETYELMVPFLLEQNQYDLALQYATTFTETFPKNINAWIDIAHICESLEKHDQAESHYLRAYDLVNEKNSIVEIYFLATGLTTVSRHQEAAILFEKIVDKNILNTVSKGLIHNWFTDGDIKNARLLAAHLYEKNPGNPFLAEVLINIYLETRQFAEAAKLFEGLVTYLSEEHRDFFLLKGMIIYNGMKRPKEVDKLVQLLSAQPELNFRNCLILCRILLQHKIYSKAVEYALHFRTKYFDNAEAHKEFLSLFRSLINSTFDAPEIIVKDNCVVSLTNQAGKQLTFLLGEASIPEVLSVKNNDWWYKKLFGKKTGDSIASDNIIGENTNFTICVIQSRESYCLLQSDELLSTRFSGQSNFRLAQYKQGNADQPIKHSLQSGRVANNISGLQIRNGYRNGQISLSSLASTFGTNIVDEWMFAVGMPDAYLISLSTNEFTVMEEGIKQNKYFVLDPISLLTHFIVLKGPIYLSRFSVKYIVSQATIDEFERYLIEIEGYRDTGMTYSQLIGEEIINWLVAPEAIRQQYDRIQAIINWCNANAQIRTSKQISELHRRERTKWTRTFGAPAYDSFLLAMDYDAILISDDETFKKTLRDQFKIKCIGSYTASLQLHKNKLINDDDFKDLLLNLIESNYASIPCPQSVIWKALKKANFQSRKPFLTALMGFVIYKKEYIPEAAITLMHRIYYAPDSFVTRESLLRATLLTLSLHPHFSDIVKEMIDSINNEPTFSVKFKRDLIDLFITAKNISEELQG